MAAPITPPVPATPNPTAHGPRPDSKLLSKYDKRLPRYTSYPTAPHFTSDVDAGQYRRWLGALDTAEPISLYLHVPYCSQLCWFCGCNTKIVARYSPVADYLGVLEREIENVAEILPSRLSLTHLHWGGGSPTIVEPDDFQRVMARLRTHFTLSADAELAVELDPRTTSRDFVGAMAAAGVTRASLGVQDFDPRVQKAINRIQTLDQTRQVVDWLGEVGISAINIDLLYGLPHQTVDGVAETVDRTVSLSPSRVALFGYAHVPWIKKHQSLIDEATLPDMAARWEQYWRASDRLADHGYVPIGIDHFAKADDPLAVAQRDGRLRRNFQGYTTDTAETLIGLGASAIGALPQGYVQNRTSVRDYGRALQPGNPATGGLATVRGIAIDNDDRLRRAAIERLMCDLFVDLGALWSGADGDAAALEAVIEKMAPLAREGLVTLEGARVTLAPWARPLTRAVCAAIDAYLDASQTAAPRHAKAI